MRIPSFFPLLLVTLGMPLWANAEENVPPADSEIARSQMMALQISPLDNPGEVGTGGYRMSSVAADYFDNEELPDGVQNGIKFKGEAESGGGKGDCTVAKTMEENFQMVGGWFYISPDSVVDSIGIQVMEQGGEYFLLTFPGDFTGWQWLEGTRDDFVPLLSPERSEFDGILEGPFKRISFVWFVKSDQPAELGLAGFVNTVE